MIRGQFVAGCKFHVVPDLEGIGSAVIRKIPAFYNVSTDFAHILHIITDQTVVDVD